jgi:membrane-associated protease RseP (regulator of RpoE activity)
MDILGLLESVVNNPLFIISLIFWPSAFLLVKLLGKKRDNVSLFIPFLALFRVKLFNRFFAKVAKKHRKIWKIWWNIGIIASFLLMIFALWFFGSNLFQLIVNPKPENAILPLIPGVTISLPMFTALLLPILVTISAHEFSHAIAAEIDDVHVKSAGVVVGGVGLILGFGAFVEVDDFHINSNVVSSLTRLRTFSAGVWTNVILAGIVFLLLNSFPQVMQIGYETNSFQVSHVISANEGGFNEGAIENGDIVYMINGTLVDRYAGTSLEQILANQTANLNCSVGDTLEFTCYDPETRDYYTRNVVLGFRSFVGFSIEQVNLTAFRVVYVYTTLEGGNNYGLITENSTIIAFDNIFVDYGQNQTFSRYLTEREPGYTVNLTSDQGEIFKINVNYQPKAAGAYLLQHGYLGINIEQHSNNSFIIADILSNTTEYGVNEGRIPVGVIITTVNGINIALENETFQEFMENNFSPRPGDILIFTDSQDTNYSLIISNIPIIPVFIGISSESYWIPSNWFGRLLGGYFPDEISQFLYYTLMITFSLALFNLLPIGIFDGGRLVKELIHMKIGTKIKKGTKKKVKYYFDENSPTQHLMTHNIEEILAVEILTESQVVEDPQHELLPKIPVEFQPLDSTGTGIIDSVILLNLESIPHESLIEVSLNYEEDLLASKKKHIYQGISWIAGAMLIASFVISIVKFNDTFFWLG